MRLQLASSLSEHFDLISFDNSKRTPPDRSLWRGIRSQFQMACELLELLRRQRPQIVHIHTCSGPTFYRSMVDLLLARLYSGAPERVILHIRGGRFADFLQGLTSLRRRLVRWALVSADRVIVLSSSWADRIGRFDPRVNIAVVANGVAWPARARTWRRRRSRFHPAARAADSGPITIVLVGTTRRSKGVDDLIEAVARLPKRTRPRLRVRIIGPDLEDRAEALQDRAVQLGLAELITITGSLSPGAVRRELLGASIFALPSYVEAFPNALLEAMACGLPSVVSNVGAIPEMIDDGVEGFLIAPGDVDGLYAGIGKLIRSFELRKRMGRAARKRVRKEFSQQRVTDSLASLYRHLLETSGAPR